MLTTRWSSHFPSSSSARSAFAHDPRPSLSSGRERVKSQSRFPKLPVSPVLSHYMMLSRWKCNP